MILAIDPGNVESAYVLIDETHGCRPRTFGKVPNETLLDDLAWLARGATVAIEMIASYGMAVGASVFETCVWIGRFDRECCITGQPAHLVFRRDVKLHLCQSARAKDSNITQALIDRFAKDTPNKGKGTKGEPGFFYGFRADVWAAFAVGVFAADNNIGGSL